MKKLFFEHFSARAHLLNKKMYKKNPLFII